MFVLVLDSTELVSDFLFRHGPSLRVQQLAADGALRVRIPSVVIAEVERQYREGLRVAIDGAKHVFDGRYGPLGLGDMSDAEAARDAAVARFPETLAALLNRPGFGLAPHAEVHVTALLQRDLEVRRPFRKIQQGTVGMRDAIIWETVLGLVPGLAPDDRLVFVSSNTKDFYNENKFHGDLLADVRQAGLTAERFFPHRTLKDFLEQHFPGQDSNREVAEMLRDTSDPAAHQLLNALTSDTPARQRLLTSLLGAAQARLTGEDLVLLRGSGLAEDLWLDPDYAVIRVVGVYGPYDVRVLGIGQEGSDHWEVDVLCHFDIDLHMLTEDATNFVRHADLHGNDVRVVADLGATTVTGRLHGTINYTSLGPDFNLTLVSLDDFEAGPTSTS